MILDDRPFTFDRIVRIAIGAGIIWGIIWLLRHLSGVLIPFAVAVLLAYLMNPLVNRIQRKIPNRAASVFISLFLVLAVLLLAGLLVVPLIAKEVAHTSYVVKDFVNNSDLAEKAQERLPPDLWQAVKDTLAREEIQQLLHTDNFWKLAGTAAQKVLPGVWGIVTGTASFLMGIVGLAIIILYLIFLLIDYDKVRKDWYELIPPKYRDQVRLFVDDFEDIMNRYFRGQLIVASLVGILFAIGFWIIGLPMGILLGLFIGMLNIVPYLQALGIIPAVILAFVQAVETGNSFWFILLKVGLVFAIVQALQDALLVPKIMGKVTGLSPAIILLSLSIWGKLLGLFGLLIALPMTYLLLAYYHAFLATGKLQRAAAPPQGGSPPPSEA